MYLFVTLLACSFGLGPSPGGEAPAVVDDTATRIDTLSPAAGSSRGGTAVTITGAGFVGEVSVTFGGVPADVTVVSPTELAVTTPSVGREVTVDVTVVSDNGADTKVAGFTFEAPVEDTGTRPDDTAGGDTDTEPDTVPTYPGLTGGVVTLDYTDVKCPACFGDTDGNGIAVLASARFHTPTDGSWLSWLPADGACSAGAAPNTLATTTLDAGPTVVLADAGTTITMTSATGTGGVTYAAADLTRSAYVAAGVYDLAAPTGADVDAFTIPAALRAATPFSTMIPEPLVNTDTSTAFQLQLDLTYGTQISWTPTVGTGFIVVTLQGWNGSSFYGSPVVCRGPDTGSFQIPVSAITNFASGTRVAITVARYEIGEVLLPNEATIEVVSTAQIVGTGTVP